MQFWATFSPTPTSQHDIHDRYSAWKVTILHSETIWVFFHFLCSVKRTWWLYEILHVVCDVFWLLFCHTVSWHVVMKYSHHGMHVSFSLRFCLFVFGLVSTTPGYLCIYICRERHDSMIFSAPTNLNMSRNALGKRNMWISWASATILYTPVHQLCADMHRYALYLILCIYIYMLKIYIYIFFFVSPPIYSWLWIHGLYIGAATAPWANFV